MCGFDSAIADRSEGCCSYRGEAPPVIAMQGVLALKLLEFSNQFAGNFLTVAV